MLGIIPHNVLHYLPFAALTDGKRYLCDEYMLFNLPGATILKFLQEKHPYPDNTVLAMANTWAEGFGELVFADQEVRAIATCYARYYNTRLYISRKDAQNSPLKETTTQNPLLREAQWRGQATETTFKKLASQFSILHLSAHGKLNITNPFFPRILLAPDTENDGALEVHEIYELNLEQTGLVVLSACDTKLGAISQGDDIVGLNRAFIYAGAPSVIASLWKVDDRATRDLMTALYLQLKFSRNTAHALRAAQRITRYKYPHPYYWAAFVLTGDPGIMRQ